jgi:hypothetical protein
MVEIDVWVNNLEDMFQLISFIACNVNHVIEYDRVLCNAG